MSSGNDSNEFPPGEGAPPPGADAPLNTGKPAVAAAPGKLIFVILFAGIFIFIIVRSLFFGEKPEVKEVPHNRKETVAAENAKNQNDLTIQPGSLPAPPAPDITAGNTISPPPPPPPPPPPQLLTPPSPGINANAPTNEALSRRIHSPMFVMSGKGTPAQEAKRRGAVAATNDPNAAFAQAVSESRSEEIQATRVTNLSSTIIEGKLIHAVLESAIDSDLPGPIRAITSHDTYAEAGKTILIPKGSRLVGTYNAQIRRGQNRVFIIWERVIRPDGVDILIDSPGVDGLGRSGMGGDVDNKYFEAFSSAFMTSALDIGTAAVGDALFGNQQTTTTNNGTGSSTTSSPTATALQQAVSNIGQVGQSIVTNALNQAPTIYIDQGTPIEVFVNRDLKFPGDITGTSGFIP